MLVYFVMNISVSGTISPAAPQGRDLYVYRIDTIQQVLAELLFLYHLLQVPVRGADQADIDGDRGIATYRTMLRRCKAVSNLACK